MDETQELIDMLEKALEGGPAQDILTEKVINCLKKAAKDAMIIAEHRRKVKEIYGEETKPQTVLVSFESDHYKKVTGKWKGDSIWTHWIKPDGKIVCINKSKVEYYEEL